MLQRRLPKSGTKPLPFETEEYLEDQEKARKRVKISQMNLPSTKGDRPGLYLPLKYDAKLLEEYYLRNPAQVFSRMLEFFSKSSYYIG
jgi:hypothetical protein